MPYKIVTRDKRYCVVKEDGQKIKCYSRLSSARKLLRALYANVEDADRAFRKSVASIYESLTGVKPNELKQMFGLRAGLDTTIQSTIRAMETPPEEWDEDTLKHVLRAIAFKSNPPSDATALDLPAYGFSLRCADLRKFDLDKLHCVRKSLAEVEKWNRIQVLAAPYDVVDTYNSYFSKDTDFRFDITTQFTPVFDSHGLGGDERDAMPVGFVREWIRAPEGLWAVVELHEEDSRSRKFAQAAADCRLGASVGMLRAGMYPPPPMETDGVYPQPTLLEQAPIVELSLIELDEESNIRPANPVAIAGYAFSDRATVKEDTQNMCQDCQQSANDLQSQIESLRAEMEKIKKERDEAMRAAQEQRMAIRMQQAAQRLAPYGLPDHIKDEFLNVYNSVAEGTQDALMSAVGRMLDHIRASAVTAPSTDSNPSLRVDNMRAMLTKQIIPAESNNGQGQESDQLTRDIQWIRSRMAVRSGG